MDIPPDPLRARLDFHQDCIVLHLIDNSVITTHMVSARDVIMAMLSEVPLNSGILPKGALWWSQSREGVEVGLWQPAKIWNLALQQGINEPPRRFKIPMPGLIFVCSPAKAPKVYAAKKKPKTLGSKIFHAPLFNLFKSGKSCPGTHKYPLNVLEIPKSFMISFFTNTADVSNRSKLYPYSLLDLWNALEMETRYPLDDLVPIGEVKDIIQQRNGG